MLHAPNESWAATTSLAPAGTAAFLAGRTRIDAHATQRRSVGLKYTRPKTFGATAWRMQKKGRCLARAPSFEAESTEESHRQLAAGRTQSSNPPAAPTWRGSVPHKAAVCPHEVPGKTIGAERTAESRTMANVPKAATLTPDVGDK